MEGNSPAFAEKGESVAIATVSEDRSGSRVFTPVAGPVPMVVGNRSLGEKPQSRPDGIPYSTNRLHVPNRQKVPAPAPIVGNVEKNGQNQVKTVTSGPGNANQTPNYRDMRQNGKQDQRVNPRQPVAGQPCGWRQSQPGVKTVNPT
jgi:hypothetical protein